MPGNLSCMTCESPQETAESDSLEAMTARHEAIARYRIYYFEPRKPRGKQKTEVERDLTYKVAKGKVQVLNDELKGRGMNRFMDPMYGLELTNGWECMSEAARERHIALGKTAEDFNK